jgi:hypothetical protein
MKGQHSCPFFEKRNINKGAMIACNFIYDR